MEGELPAALFTLPFLAIHFLCNRGKKDSDQEDDQCQELGTTTGGGTQTCEKDHEIWRRPFEMQEVLDLIWDFVKQYELDYEEARNRRHPNMPIDALQKMLGIAFLKAKWKIHGALYGFDGKWQNDYGQEFVIDAGVISMEVGGKIIQQKILVDEKKELFLLEEPEGKPSVWSMPMNGNTIWSSRSRGSTINQIKWTRVLEKGSSFDYAWTDSEFQKDDVVYLVSLYADMELNGQEAVVVESADESGKCLIRLNLSGENVRVFEKNLAHIEHKQAKRSVLL